MRRHQGFTLLELMLVLLIIGILAAIAIPRFLGQKDRAYVVTMRSDLRNLVSVQEAYFSGEQVYATSQALLNYSTSAGVTVGIVSADSSGWSATAKHNATGKTCGVFMGTATPPAGSTTAGLVNCS